MEEPNKIKFSLRQSYLEFINVALLNSTLLNYLDKIDILGFHKLMYAGLLITCKTIFDTLKTVGNIDIKSILLKDDVKNYIYEENSNVLSYFVTIIKNTNNIYVNGYVNACLESELTLIKPVFESLKANELFFGDKYNNVMTNYRTSINDENMYDKFVELFVLVMCDVSILFYNYMYDVVFDNRGRIKHMDKFDENLKKSIETVDNLKNIYNTYFNISNLPDYLNTDVDDISVSSDSSFCDSEFSKQFNGHLHKTIDEVLAEKFLSINTYHNDNELNN